MTPQAAAVWVTSAAANKSVRNRLSVAGAFSCWLNSEGLPVDLTGEWEADVRKHHPRIYGKKQAKNPARFLTYTSLSGRTWVESRDQLAISRSPTKFWNPSAVLLYWRWVARCRGLARNADYRAPSSGND